MIFSKVVEYFSSTPKEDRTHVPAHFVGHDQTDEFRAFLADLRPSDELEPNSGTNSAQSDGS